MAVPVVHGIGSRRKSLPGLAPVRGSPGSLAIDHIGGDGQNGSGGNPAPVTMVPLHIIHEGMDHLHSQPVHPVIVISILGKIPLYLIIPDNSKLVPDGPHPGISDGRQGIRHHRQPGNSGSKPAGHMHIVKGHLKPLIAVLVMHVVDNVQAVDIHACQPFHHIPVPVHDLIKLQILGGNRPVLRSHLSAADLVHPAVDGVKQALGQIGPGPEKLHFLAHPHGRHTAGNGIVIPVGHPHQVVILILDRRRLDGGLGTEPFEMLRQPHRPEHRQVGLRRRAQIVEGVEIAEGHFSHQMPPVNAHASDGFRYPGRVPGKQRVVLRGPGEFHQPQLHDEMIHKLLDFLLPVPALCQVPLRVNVQEGGGAPQGHGRAVLLLHGGQISEIGPLDRLPHIPGRPGNVKTVDCSQFL